ncbi:MAG TPA: hypothetical protein VIM69_10960 [Opitutaceae bacterium]
MLIVFGSKLWTISTYGSDLPFWDQWDAEGAKLFLPSAQGTLQIGDFFAPHNEHRILFTRLLAFGLWKANGQWDARLEMTVNVFVHIAAIALLLGVLKRLIKPSTWMLACLMAVVLCSLPLSWENTLGGFQSQFYFLLLFSVAHLACTFGTKENGLVWWFGQITGLCAVVSMGSGFFSAAVVVLLYTTQIIQERTRPSFHRVTIIALNVVFIILGFLLRTDVPEHHVLRASSLHDLLGSIALLLAWPAPWRLASIFAISAILLACKDCWKAERRPDVQVFIWAMTAWSTLQILALAVARGGAPTVLSPRYFDLLDITVLLTCVLLNEFALSAASPKKHLIFWSICSAWWLCVAVGVDWQYRVVFNDPLRSLKSLNSRRADIVRGYVQNEKDAFFKAVPVEELPYPKSEPLAAWLDEPAIRLSLPADVRASMPIPASPDVSLEGFRSINSSSLSGAPAHYRYWTRSPNVASADATFQSDWIPKPDFPYLRFWVRGNSGQDQLWLQTASDTIPLNIPNAAPKDWRAITVPAPDHHYRLFANTKPGSVLSFSEPVEVALGSKLNEDFLKLWPFFLYGGIILFPASLLDCFLHRTRPTSGEI